MQNILWYDDIGGSMENREETIKKKMKQILLEIEMNYLNEERVRQLKLVYEELKKEYTQLLLNQYTEERKKK